MRKKIGRLAARIVPEPAEMIDTATIVEWLIRRGTKRHLPVSRRKFFSADRLGKAGVDVAEVRNPDIANFTDMTLTDQFDSLLILFAGALLRPDLDDSSIVLFSFNHPTAFAHEESEMLLDVNVLAGGAGQDCHECMPAIWGGNDDRVNVFAAKHPVKIFDSFILVPVFFSHNSHPFAQVRFVYFADG